MTLETPNSTVTTGPDPSRARMYVAAGVICAFLTVWFMFSNVFLVPVFCLSGLFCVWRGWKNGANRALLLVIFAVCGLPGLIAGIWLILLLPNLPELKVGGVSYQRNG